MLLSVQHLLSHHVLCSETGCLGAGLSGHPSLQRSNASQLKRFDCYNSAGIKHDKLPNLPPPLLQYCMRRCLQDAMDVASVSLSDGEPERVISGGAFKDGESKHLVSRAASFLSANELGSLRPLLLHIRDDSKLPLIDKPEWRVCHAR